MYVYVLIASLHECDNIIEVFINRDKAIQKQNKLIMKSKGMNEPPIYRLETHILKD